ncbi:MAG: hypothetical protein GX877_06825 [Bacteroidales bacterium]|nr:hypothetical protein [Bacteroidales bacterium]
MKEERKKVTIRDYMKECELQMLGCRESIDGTRVNAFKVLTRLLEDNGFWSIPEVLAITDRYVFRDRVTPKVNKDQPEKNSQTLSENLLQNYTMRSTVRIFSTLSGQSIHF